MQEQPNAVEIRLPHSMLGTGLRHWCSTCGRSARTASGLQRLHRDGCTGAGTTRRSAPSARRTLAAAMSVATHFVKRRLIVKQPRPKEWPAGGELLPVHPDDLSSGAVNSSDGGASAPAGLPGSGSSVPAAPSRFPAAPSLREYAAGWGHRLETVGGWHTCQHCGKFASATLPPRAGRFATICPGAPANPTAARRRDRILSGREP